MNLASAFAQSARSHPSKTAIFWGDREISYTELLASSLGMAGKMRDMGIGKGDRVALWLKNCPEFVAVLFGIFHAGAVAVPVNCFLKPDEVSYILKDSGAGLLVTDPEFAAHLPTLHGSVPGLKQLISDEVFGMRAGEALERDDISEPDLAVLIYTSGTTGKPKGAMLSHGNLLHNVESCRIVLQTVEGDRIAVLLPLFHSYMLTVGTLLPMLVGGSMVLVKSLHPPRAALQEILQRRTTVLPAIPQFYRSMAHAPVEGPLPVRLFISGAAPLPTQVLRDFEAKFKVPLIEGYGLSEASPVVAKNPLNGARKPGSIGVPVTNVEVSVQDDSGNMLPDHEVGEICVRGGNVMMGYWNKPEETAKVMRGGWLLTGDIGYRDAEGYFYITDRKKDMLLVNGINVYPREIEEVIYEFPGVKEAAVIGKPDPRKGEQPVAFVAPVDGTPVDVPALQQFMKGKLADYKVPRKIVSLPALPRNAAGKILKTTLREIPLES